MSYLSLLTSLTVTPFVVTESPTFKIASRMPGVAHRVPKRLDRRCLRLYTYYLAVTTIGAQIDLAKYPLDAPRSDKWYSLVARCRNDLDAKGMFELPGFLTADALRESAATILPRMANESVEIRREHNIYFLDKVDGLTDDHPALTKIMTINHTLCADQLVDTPVTTVYE